jgi:hypothetical protein
MLINESPRKYGNKVVIERGKKVIYAVLKKALYGSLVSSLLFWRDLTSFFKEIGFEPNPYDQCVMNKTHGSKQLTVCWYVDDIKMSHVDEGALEWLIKKLGNRYGGVSPLTVSRGKIHEFLGMVIDFTRKGEVSLDMQKHIQDILETGTTDMKGRAETPASSHLFQTRLEATRLEPKDGDLFRTLIAKILYVAGRSRPDLKLALSFLTTRVRAPDQDDKLKLTRLVKYIRATKHLKLTIEAASIHTIKWWVDAAYAVHVDMRGHTGGMMSMGEGAMITKSTKHKINTRSSTEAEIVGVDDMMGHMMWTLRFLDAQGYQIDENILYQDNQSAILLENNGRSSCSRRTKHIDTRYFYITDRINKKEIKVEYCPTGDMLGDFFTKPLQGSLFRKLRAKVMNLKDDCPEESKEKKMILRESQECVALPCRVTAVQAVTDNGVNNGSSPGKDVNKYKLVTLRN